MAEAFPPREQMIEAIKAMRVQRVNIKKRMEFLTMRRDEIYESSSIFENLDHYPRTPPSAKFFMNSCRTESDNEEMLIRTNRDKLFAAIANKKLFFQKIDNEMSFINTKQISQFVSQQDSLRNERLSLINTMSQIVSALTELHPNEKILEEFNAQFTKCKDNINMLHMKQNELLGHRDELNTLWKKKIQLGESLRESQVSKNMISESEHVQRRTSDLMPEPFMMFGH